jgi:hypothetical protein
VIERSREAVEPRDVAAGDRDAVAELQELSSGGGADAARATGDQADG